jgi:DNA-binding NarL/FixJ family response regulator
MPNELLRILLVDDHPLVRNGLRALLASVPELTIVGEAASGEEAIARATELLPDIILMDLNMPGVNGVEATRRILQAQPHVGIIVLTMLEDDASVFAAMRAGARGYLLKGADQTEVLRASPHRRAWGSDLQSAHRPAVDAVLRQYAAYPASQCLSRLE